MSSLGFEPRSLLRPFIGRKHRWRPIGGNGWGKPYFSSLDRNVRIFGFPFLAPPSSQPTNTFTLNTSSPDTLQWATLCLRAAIIRITEEFSRVFQYHIVLSISFGLTIQIVALQGSAKILELQLWRTLQNALYCASAPWKASGLQVIRKIMRLPIKTFISKGSHLRALFVMMIFGIFSIMCFHSILQWF